MAHSSEGLGSPKYTVKGVYITSSANTHVQILGKNSKIVDSRILIETKNDFTHTMVNQPRVAFIK